MSADPDAIQLPSFADVEAACGRIRPHAKRTPVLSCSSLNDATGAQLLFKCENFQHAGAFKMRGATNAVFSLDPDEARAGVATHSSGNHAGALARAARSRGIPAFLVMPSSAPRVKVAAVREYGGQISFCEPTLPAREAGLEEIVSGTGAAVVHPFNDPRVIAGQATAAVELLEQVPVLDSIVAPIGGGGLLSGCSLAVSHLRPDLELFGAEPLGADDAFRSLAAGRIIPSTNPQTIADGLLTSLGSLTFSILNRDKREILTASDESIVLAMRALMERAKLVVEPSGAVPLAAVFEHASRFRGRTVGLIVSGGNIDLDRLPWHEHT